MPDEELAQAIGAEVIGGTVVYVHPDDNAVSLDLDKQRLSDIEGMTNARQLGGYVNTEGRKIKQNVILRTGKPSDGSENDLRLLSEKYHVSDMVDFRTESEAQTAPEPTVEGAVNHHIPLNIAGDMSFLVTDEFKQAYAKAMQSGDKGEILLLLAQNNMLPTPEMYAYFLGDEATDGYRQFFDILLNKPEDSAVLFHCTQGKDRTGMGAALFLYALDFDDDTVLSDYLMTNLANTDIIDN
ncbi:MAG: tyrosine-protein phosphatase, partial [Firmicutes bacterium]|nr:tyrosine-protein phosphatase [Bacillota bacterium]